jgi:hypothetical protein
VADPETTARLRSLLDRLDEARGRLEQAESSEAAVDILQDLAELAKEAQAEIDRARRTGARPAGGDAQA